MAIGSPVTLSQLQGLARPAARIKVLPEDWRVTEELERSFADSGEHYYLYVRKRCLSTIPVANRLAKAYGTLVWKVLRRAQRNPEATLSLIPRDTLRIIVREVVAAETERLTLVYSTRLAAGAASYRG